MIKWEAALAVTIDEPILMMFGVFEEVIAPGTTVIPTSIEEVSTGTTVIPISRLTTLSDMGLEAAVGIEATVLPTWRRAVYVPERVPAASDPDGVVVAEAGWVGPGAGMAVVVW